MQVLTVDFKSPDAPAQFAKSLKETGFAVIKNHPIQPALFHGVYGEWEKFFNSDEKHDYMFKRDYDKVQDGYFPPEVAEKAKGFDVLDLKEFYHVYPVGRMPKSVSGDTLKLRQEMMNMAQVLLGWVQDNTPKDITDKLSMPLPDMVDADYQTVLRVLHYPPLTGDHPEGAVRAAAHEDINLITLLVSATQPGLQVLDADGNWLDVPCEEDSIVVNVGDMLQEATDRYYVATKHQVINPLDPVEAKKARFSIPLFLHAKGEVRLSDRVTAKEYLQERLAELGLM